MATIYLIRHGQASFGAENYDQLSELGRRQATLVGRYLRDTGVVLDAAYSGDLSRQRETAKLALESQPTAVSHTIDARFNEIDNDAQVKLLLPEVVKRDASIQALVEKGLSSSKDYQKAIEAVFNLWVSPECPAVELQSWSQYSSAAIAALRAVMTAQGAGKNIAIFTSGGTLATLTAHVLGLDGANTYPLYEPITNCSITQFFYNADKVSLSYFNDTSYLRVYGAETDEKLVTYR